VRGVLAFALAAAAAPLAHGELRVVDDAGAQITLVAPARRIVSLAPHATELLVAAGAGGLVVGVVDGSNHPAQARALPVIGDARAIDVERIVALHPDLVVTWPYTSPAQVGKLAARGIAVFTTDPRTIDGIAADIERLGTLAGTAPVAAQSARRFRDTLAHATAAAVGRSRIRVFYQIWAEPIYTIGGRHLISQAIVACGGENVFASLVLPAPQVSVEAVIAARPEAIVASTTSSLDADALAALVTRPSRFVNAHFLNPAYLIPLVEVSPAKATAEGTFAALKALIESAGKVVVRCAPSPGLSTPSMV